MALEQWEIDLRRQLEGKINTKPAQKDWEQELVEEIKPRNEKSSEPTSNTILMLVLLILLGGAMLFAYDSKSGGRVQSWIASKLNSSAVNEQPVQPSTIRATNYDAEIASLRADVQRLDADNKAKLDSLTTKVQFNSDRLTLMGLLLNENFLIVRNNYNKGHLIFFNRDWTLDQMPHYLQLAESDKEYLKKFVKPGQ